MRAFAAIVCAALAALHLMGAAMAGERGSAYSAAGRCGPYPRLALETPDGLCAGIVAGPADGLRMPRTLVEVAPGELILADMGSWNRGDGRLLRLTLDGKSGVGVETLFQKLDVPHGLAIGPDGLVYVGEQDEIWRFDPRNPAASRESLTKDFPHEGLHRLKVLLFDRDGSLIVNLGAVTDRCERDNGRVPSPCPADRIEAKEAALWRITFEWPGGKVVSFKPVAQGLRNSVALAIHPKSGLLLQGENNIDLGDPDEPPEELNIIRQGAHYGWPYCTGIGDPVPDYRRFKPDCTRYEKPAALLPAHTAPLALHYEPADGLPGLAGRLLATLHGYRPGGQRVVACEVAEDGTPLARSKGGMARCVNVISGWDARPNLRPKGAPVGILRSRDGSLWLTEDKNRTVIVLMRTDSGAAGGGGEGKLESVATSAGEAPKGWRDFHAHTLRPRCGSCHQFLKGRDAVAWSATVDAGWVEGDEGRQWLLIRSMLGEGVRRAMPPPKGFAKGSRDAERLEAFIATLPR